jgi:hypothetical protein
VIRALVLAIVFGGLGACGDTMQEPVGPPAGLPFASASNDCAPWDGHAITVLLSATAGSDTGGIDASSRPLVRVSVYPRSGLATNQRFSWPADPEQASGVRCLAGAACESASRGWVRISGEPDSVLSGSLELHFADGSAVAGGFQARWIHRTVLCG